MLACANSNKRSATFSRYSFATSALIEDTICESNPDDVVLPGLAFNTPDPDNTPDAVWEATPEVDAPSLEAVDPKDGGKNFLLVVLFKNFVFESGLPFSRPCLDTSVKN